jgi:hypothetical protein
MTSFQSGVDRCSLRGKNVARKSVVWQAPKATLAGRFEEEYENSIRWRWASAGRRTARGLQWLAARA